MPAKKKPRNVRFVGGGDLGSVQAPFPVATLFANSGKLTIHFGLDTYRFLPHQVIVFHGSKNGIQIEHTVKNYPSSILFKGLGSTYQILKQIQQTGFTPCGDAENAIAKDNSVRPAAVAVLILLYHGIGYATLHSYFMLNHFEREYYIPGEREAMGLSILLLSLLFIYCVPFIQKLIVKPGRSFNEIKQIFAFLIWGNSILLAIFVTQFIRQDLLHSTFSVCINLIGFSSIFWLPVVRNFCLGGD